MPQFTLVAEKVPSNVLVLTKHESLRARYPDERDITQ
jgi:hypothetical protein